MCVTTCFLPPAPRRRASALARAWVACSVWAATSAGAALAHTSSWEPGLRSADCQRLQLTAAQLRQLRLAQVQLQSLGLELQLEGCPRVGRGRQAVSVLAVKVLVRDSATASEAVRGPLADGEEVDMGSELVWPDRAAVPDSDDVSPDVAFNRQWLAQLLGARGFAVLPGHWWGFRPQP